MNKSNKSKLELLKDLEKEVINLGRSQMNNYMILNWIDKQRKLINGK